MFATCYTACTLEIKSYENYIPPVRFHRVNKQRPVVVVMLEARSYKTALSMFHERNI